MLIADDGGGYARICEALLNRVAERADAGRFLHPRAVSLAPTTGRDGVEWTRDLCATGRQLGLPQAPLENAAAALRPRDLRAGGGFDLVLCTSLDVLERVRQLGTEGKGVGPVTAYSLADFLLSAE